MKIGIEAFDGDEATTIDEVSGRVGAEALPVGSFSRLIPSVGLQRMVLGNRYGPWADSAYAKTLRDRLTPRIGFTSHTQNLYRSMEILPIPFHVSFLPGLRPGAGFWVRGLRSVTRYGAFVIPS